MPLPERIGHDVARDAGRAVLSAALADADALARVRAILQPDDFGDTRLTRAFGAILRVADRGEPVDPITVAHELERLGDLEPAGGMPFLADLIDEVPTTANAAYHARFVVEAAKHRALVALADEARSSAAAGEPSIDIAVRHRDALDVFVRDATTAQWPGAIRAADAPAATPVEWIVRDLLPAGELALVVGDGGSFKSSLACHVAAAVAGGYSVFDRHVTTQGAVLIVSAEDPLEIVTMRIRASAVGHAWSVTDVLNGVHIVAEPDASLGDPIWQSRIRREAERVSARLIVLDPFADLIGGDENSNSELRPVLRFLRQLGRDTGASVVVVHHAGKMGQGKRSLDRIRGASALPSAARSILFLDFGPEGVRVEHLKSSRAPRLDPFALARTIVSDPADRSLWHSARLGVEARQTLALNHAQQFVMAQVTASPRTLSTSDLKKAAIGTGVSAPDVSAAIASLQSCGRIAFESGPRGARLWYPPTLPETPGKVSSDTLPTLPEGCPATSNDAASDLAAPEGCGARSPAQKPASATSFDDDRGPALHQPVSASVHAASRWWE